jgi:RNA polymerase sigma-70 factor (ECF subfamily)
MNAAGHPVQRRHLIAAAQHGDAAAIRSLLAASQPDIRRYARRACRAEDIDDAVQETLWRVHTRIGRLKVVSAYAAWLFKIVRRECHRLTRRQMLAGPVTQLENDLALATRPTADLLLDIANAIESLPQHYRTIVLMRDVEDRTISEIASSLTLSREAVKARLHRARQLLREYMKD